jgi:CxxC motif-containing protein (DUF1111 family)
MSRIAIPLLLALGSACAQDDDDPLEGLEVVGADPTDLPIAGIDDEWRARFDEGDIRFEQRFREPQGLGPVYIRQACGSCHEGDAKGPGFVTKMVAVEADGITPLADQSVLAYGATVRPYAAGGAATPLDVPGDGVLVRTSTRIGPAVFGRGYVDAIADAEIERIEAAQAERDDGISGRIHRVAWQSEANPDTRFHSYGPQTTGLIGRFGLKARIATADEFAADAFQGDMSLTNPLRPVELPNPDALDDDAHTGIDVDEETVNVVGDYVRLLSIPKREDPESDADLAAGAELFDAVDCDACHTPSMRTRADYPIPQLADVDAFVYSDLLLHDMGEDLADGLVENDASGSEWKTAPLIGLRHLRSYLHDGRASTVAEAIELHDGEGSEATPIVEAYRALSDDERDRLIAYVETL